MILFFALSLLIILSMALGYILLPLAN